MQKKGAANHQKIVEAANELFYQQGYDHTSFSQIAEAANIPRGNFYYYFKTKDEILEAVVDKRIEDIDQMLKSWASSTNDPVERIRMFFTMPYTISDDVARYGCPMGSLSTELGKTRPDLSDRTRQMFDLFVTWLREQFAEAGFENAHDQATHLMVCMQGAAALAHVYNDPDIIKREVKLAEQKLEDLIASRH